MTYAALTTARLGLRTAAVVGVDEPARTADELDLLREAGVDAPARPARRGADLPQRRDADRPRPDAASRRASRCRSRPLPESWRPRPGLVDRTGRRRGARRLGRRPPPDGAYVGVAWQGFLRDPPAGERVTRRPPAPTPTPRAGRRRRREPPRRRPGHAADRPVPAPPARRPAARDPGRRGRPPRHPRRRTAAVERRCATGRPTSDRELDPTGAGDMFLAALISAPPGGPASAGRARDGRTCAFAAAAASLVVEGPGLDGVPGPGAVLVRMARERVRQLSRRRRGADRDGASDRPDDRRADGSGSARGGGPVDSRIRRTVGRQDRSSAAPSRPGPSGPPRDRALGQPAPTAQRPISARCLARRS